MDKTNMGIVRSSNNSGTVKITPVKDRRLPTLSKRYTPEEIELSIRKNYGTLTYICLDLDCTVQQLEYYLRKHPQMEAIRNEARNAIVDLAEKTIVEAMKAGNLNAALYTVKTLGRNRGWNESATLNVNVMSESEKEKAIKKLFGIDNEEETEQTEESVS